MLDGLDADEAAGIAGGALSDIVKLPSQSNFNQFFILQAQAALGQLDRGVESARGVKDHARIRAFIDAVRGA